MFENTKLLSLSTCAVIGLGFMSAFGSFSPEGLSATTVANDRTPTSVVETGFASLSLSARNDGFVRPQAEDDPCNNFTFAFFNQRCTPTRKTHAVRDKHRVAIFIIGHDASSPSLTAKSAGTRETHPDRATRTKVTPRGQTGTNDLAPGGRAEFFEANERLLRDAPAESRLDCKQSWPYYEPSCLRDASHGTGRAVRVIAIDRPNTVKRVSM